jgi:GNAT superfamily N-acetyltransferase
MVKIIVSIDKITDYSSHPGWVECSLCDKGNQKHTFIDKIPVFTALDLAPDDDYPQTGYVRGIILREWADEAGRKILTVNTEIPDYVCTVEGVYEFDLLENQVVIDTTAANTTNFTGVNLSVRAMREGDIDIIIGNFNEQGWQKPKDVLEEYLSRQGNEEIYVFIAECSNDIAGYAVLNRNTQSGPFANINIPEINDLNVFKKYQRQGIGNTILDMAEGKASLLSHRVSLGVGLHNGYGAAQRMYVKRGYLPDGTGVWYNNERLEEQAPCKNDDGLILYFYKDLR